MPIDSEHPIYKHYKVQVEDCRNAYEGGRAVKEAGVRYLPQLKSQDGEQYRNYKERALFFAITSKTVSALVGMVMVREPQVEASDGLDPYFKDNQGAQFLEICSTTAQEVLLTGAYGLYIDAPAEGGEPRICRYTRENVINWELDGDGRPTMVMLRETVQVPKQGDRYEKEDKVYYRELWLDSSGVFNVTMYDDKKVPVASFVPTVRRQPMDHIPFFMINPLGVSFDLAKPPMMDIVDLNISHYRTSADLEHGRHFTGLPTPVIVGAEAGTTLYIGSEAAWVIPNADGDVKYLEFTGQGLQSLEKAMVEKQSQMASMSARMLDNSKRGSEAAETVKLRYMSETAGLITVVRSVEDGLNQVYAEIADIVGEPVPVIQMNKEFMDPKLTAAELTALFKGYIDGALTTDTLIYNLRKGDVISAKETDETIRAEMDERRKERIEQNSQQPAFGRPA